MDHVHLSRIANKLRLDRRQFVLVAYDVIAMVSTGSRWSMPDLDQPQESHE